MVYFRLDRPLQLVLVGAALAVGPACGSSGDDDATTDADTTTDADAGADAEAGPDADADADADPDVPAEADVGADADADPDADAEIGIDTWEVVDPLPGPMCSEVPSFTLGTTNLSSETDKATAQVLLTGSVRPYGDPCPTAVCLTVTPEGGAGTVDGYLAVDAYTTRFTYTNPALTDWRPVRLDLAWNLYCSDLTGLESEEVVRGTAWACRGLDGNVMIAENVGDCSFVVDPPPPPMAHTLPPGSGTPPPGFQLQSRPQHDGSTRLVAEHSAGICKWTAVGGRLERVSETEAIFRPDRSARTALVQVAALSPDGISVRVWRRHRG